MNRCSQHCWPGDSSYVTLWLDLLFMLQPSVLIKLKPEIRIALNNEEENTMVNIDGLTYLSAVLNEALCMYPASIGHLARVTSPEGCAIASRFVPGNIYVL